MRWSAVFAGTALGIGIWILLLALGMGLGLMAVDIDDTGSLEHLGIWSGVWALVAPLIAIFLGALLTGRLSSARARRIGAMHGAVTWALSIVLGVWAVLTVVSAMVGGVARVGGAAANATTSLVGDAAKAGGSVDLDTAMSSLGIDTNDLIAPINNRLQREGKPPVTAAQLKATVQAVAQRGLHEGRLDKQVLVQELARNTALSQADAQDIANQFGDRYQTLATKVHQGAGQVEQGAVDVAQQAADKTGKALLWAGIMMLVSLAAALGGGALGAGERTVSTSARTTTTVMPPPMPPTTPREPSDLG